MDPIKVQWLFLKAVPCFCLKRMSEFMRYQLVSTSEASISRPISVGDILVFVNFTGKMLDPDPLKKVTDPDPQPWFKLS